MDKVLEDASPAFKSESLDLDLGHQRAVLKVLLALLMPAGILFALINIYRGVYLLAAAELVFAIAAIRFWPKIKVTNKPQKIAAWFTFPIFLTISYAIYLPDASVTMFAWVYIVPVLAYSAMGARKGFLISAFFYISVGTQYFLKFGQLPAYQSFVAVLNVVVCSVALWGFVHAYEKARQRSHERLSLLAVTDPLTGLSNRLSLEGTFERRKAASAEVGEKMGVIMVDLDFFKNINDNYGHDCGDEVLRRVAVVLKNSVRAEDSVFRMGGEEFCLIVPRIGEEQLHNTAEALRERVQNLVINFEDQRIAVTISVGAVILSDMHQDLDSMLTEADRRLYCAKESGRNRVVFEGSQEVQAA